MNDVFFTETINQLKEKGLKRVLRNVEGPQDRCIKIDGRELLNFCSNNYLGLANDSRLKQAAIESIKGEGFGSGASRLVCGNMTAHSELEKTLAHFKGTEQCLVFSTGYMANVGIISSLVGREDLILADKLNHASIIDGAMLSGAKFKRYAHKDMTALENILKDSSEYKKKLIVSDTVFSMDGDIAPLDKIVELAKQYDAMVMVDEAHGFGVLGKDGKGTVQHFGLENEIDIQMGTLSKAAGSFGAYCCGTESLISFLINRARSFIYTTGMPPNVAAASQKAVTIIQSEPERRERLWKNTKYMHDELKRMGYDTLDSQTPIIPILTGDPNLTIEFSQKLFEAGVFISAIRPPTVPVNTSRLRFTLMATHTEKDLDFALQQLQTIGKQLCIL